MGIRINGSTSGYTEIDAPAEGGNSTAGIILPSGSTTDRPASGQAGQVRFNTTTGQLEYWSTTSDTPQWRTITQGPLNTIAVHYLVIAGGGSGGGYGQAGGGGAGGYRTSWGSGNISGGNSPVESALTLEPEVGYTVTVGDGGAATTNQGGNKGQDSVLHTITSDGGGSGGSHSCQYNDPSTYLSGGSSGGGGTYHDTQGTPTANQGMTGGWGMGDCANSGAATGSGQNAYGTPYSGGGGGGASQNGAHGAVSGGGDGGDGMASDITGTSVTRAGGGGGGVGSVNYQGYGGAGGAGGGGRGEGYNDGAPDGAVNTGSGGGGAGYFNARSSGAGGSGVVIIRIPNTHSATFSGVTASAASTVGTDRVYTVTAGTGTVTFTKD